jgi:tetrahydromethanopterin S-methyltransferase subunit E
MYMDGGLTLGLAPNISYKKRQYKKEIFSWPACLLHMQAVGGPIAYIIYVKAVVLVILLTFAVAFLLQEDFFLVVTSRA